MKINLFVPIVVASTVIGLTPIGAMAQNVNDDADYNAPTTTPPSYQVSPDSATTPSADRNGNAGQSGQSTDPTKQGPVRLARFSLVDGNVTWRATATDDWATAAVNVPLREGAQLSATDGGRAEIQFDDGSYLRLGAGAIVTIQTLYSDQNGEYTEIQLNKGLLSMTLKNKQSVYQIDTPVIAVKASGGSEFRVGVNDGVEASVRQGSVTVTGPNSNVTLIANNYIYLADQNSQIYITAAPQEDSWDRWCDDRDSTVADDETTSHCPPDVAVCAGDLSSYGVWREDPEYGWVWSPTVDDPGWRPYEYGHWVDCEPFGWTWCSDEPWGWAPYHYGTWYRASYGWAWVPGPERQYWSPAVVSFTDCDGEVGWCPLAPREVDYASLSFGFGRGGSFFGFSIAQAGCYYPGANNICIGFSFDTFDVNRHGPFRPGFGGFGGRPFPVGGRFIPRNALYGGVMTADRGSFGEGENFHRLADNGRDFFARGQTYGQLHDGGRPFSGPVDIRPRQDSFSPTHVSNQSVRPSQDIFNRPVFRAYAPENGTHFVPTDPARSFNSDPGNFPRHGNPANDGPIVAPGTAGNNSGQVRSNLQYAPQNGYSRPETDTNTSRNSWNNFQRSYNSTDTVHTQDAPRQDYNYSPQRNYNADEYRVNNGTPVRSSGNYDRSSTTRQQYQSRSNNNRETDR